MEPIICKNIIVIFFMGSNTLWALNSKCTPPRTPEQGHSGLLCTSITGIPGIPGHHQGACQKCRILDPTQAQGIRRKNGSASQETQTPALKQWQGDRGSVCWEYTCHDSAQGVPGPGVGDRGFCILKKLRKEASQRFWGNFLGKNPCFRKVLTKIFNIFPTIVNKPYLHYLSNLFHTTDGTIRLEKRITTFSYSFLTD